MGEVNTATATTDNPPDPSTVQATPDRPAWLPEKFKSPEDLATAYKALETKLGTPAVETPVQQTQTPPQQITFDMTKYETEFAKDGKLSDTSYQELQGRGFAKDVVDNYVTGRQATYQAQADALLAPVGGKGGYDAMIQWAAQKLPADAVAAYNEAMQTNNPAVIKTAIAGLHAQYKLSNGSDPKLVGGGSNVTTGPAPFKSQAQLTEAMSDPRYSRDPAYQQEVLDRLAASQI